MSESAAQAGVARVRAFYETLEPRSLERLGEVYAPDVYFRDPFNEVRGVDAIRVIFARMFEQLADCRFEIVETAVEGANAFMTWNMRFRIRRHRPEVVQTIHGATHLRFQSDGRVSYHRDYWDAAEELYAKLPVVGGLMRYLKRRMG